VRQAGAVSWPGAIIQFWISALHDDPARSQPDQRMTPAGIGPSGVLRRADIQRWIIAYSTERSMHANAIIRRCDIANPQHARRTNPEH